MYISFFLYSFDTLIIEEFSLWSIFSVFQSEIFTFVKSFGFWINPLYVTLYCMLLFHKIFFFFIALGCISFFLFLMKMYPYDLQQFMIRWGQKKASYMQKPRWEFSEGPKNFKGSCLTSILVSTNFSFFVSSVDSSNNLSTSNVGNNK